MLERVQTRAFGRHLEQGVRSNAALITSLSERRLAIVGFLQQVAQARGARPTFSSWARAFCASPYARSRVAVKGSDQL